VCYRREERRRGGNRHCNTLHFTRRERRGERVFIGTIMIYKARCV
jgi:hypothetical protein